MPSGLCAGTVSWCQCVGLVKVVLSGRRTAPQETVFPNALGSGLLWLRDWNHNYSTCEPRFWRGSVPWHRHGSHQGLKETGVLFLTPSPFLAPAKLPTNCIVSLPTPSWVSELISCPADSQVKNKPRNVKTCFYSERWGLQRGFKLKKTWILERNFSGRNAFLLPSWSRRGIF